MNTMLPSEEWFESCYDNRDKIVPIIGQDIFMCKTSGGEQMSFQYYIVDYFKAKGFLNGIEDSLVELMKKDGYRGMSLLSSICQIPRYNPDKVEIHKRSQFETEIEKAAKQTTITLVDTVTDFLLVSKPSIIITTSPFPVIENSLKEKGITYSSAYFSIKDSTSGQFVGDVNLNSKCVIHLFGATEDICNKVWASNERRLLCYLHSLHTYEIQSEKLRNCLDDSILWVMGCNLPEWLFQFLLYPLKGDKIEAPESMWFGNIQDEKQLTSINRYFSIYSCNATNYAFLTGLTEYFIKRNKESSTIEELEQTVKDEQTFDYFISFRDPADKYIAQSVADILKKHGCTVWISTEQDLAGKPWDAIIKALDHSRHVIPIVTTTYLREFATEKIQYSSSQNVYNVTEAVIKYAKECNEDAFILPIRKLNSPITIAKGFLPQDVDFFEAIQHYTTNDLLNPFFDSKELNYYHWCETESKEDFSHSIYNAELWARRSKIGKTPSELGVSIKDFITLIPNSNE